MTCPTCSQSLPGTLSAIQAAKLLGISRNAVYKMLKTGTLQRHESGGISLESVEARKDHGRSPNPEEVSR